MNILFIHPNMPGQYKHLVQYYAKDPKNKVVFITKPKPNVNIPNVVKVEYESSREPKPDTHRYIIGFERCVTIGQEVWRMCKKIKEKGFVPDVIVGHLGWGDGLFIKDIYPDTPVLGFMEFFYGGDSSDVTFLENNKPLAPDELARIRMKNAVHLFNLSQSDWCISPTRFQMERHPKDFWPRISVLHDGIDTDAVQPRDSKTLSLPGGIKLDKSKHEVVTYISRNFEPYRGFPQFMHAAEKILRDRPNCHIVMVGQDGVSYGKQPVGHPHWRAKMMKEVNLPKDRFHFLGYLQYNDMVKLMQFSDAHIYLTVPFVLSWSMMESMSAGCLLIGSATEPVMEVLKDGYNGLLVDFFNIDAMAKKIGYALDNKEAMKILRRNARQTIERFYSLKQVMPLHVSLIDDIRRGLLPPPTHARIMEYQEQLIKEAA